MVAAVGDALARLRGGDLTQRLEIPFSEAYEPLRRDLNAVIDQLQQTLYMTAWQKTDAKFPYSPENTGMTLAPVATYEPYVSSTPTSCQMTRPSAS